MIKIIKDIEIIILCNIFAIISIRMCYNILLEIINKFKKIEDLISVIIIYLGIKILLEYININFCNYICMCIILIIKMLNMIQNKTIKCFIFSIMRNINAI